MSRTIRTALAGAALAASLSPVAASADPLPWPPPTTGVGQCTLHWYAVPIFSDDVPFTPYIPHCVW